MTKTGLSLAAFGLAAGIALLGCGGGGGGGGGGIHSPYDGTYFTDFTRAPDTSILIFVARNNTADIIIADITGEIYDGGGTLDPGTGAFTATANQTGRLPVQIAGTAVLGNPSVMNLTLTGGISKTLTVPRVLGEDLTLVSGTYVITQTASSGSGGSGTGTMVIGQDGSISAMINLNGGGVETVIPNSFIPPVGSGGLDGTATIQGSQVTFHYGAAFTLFNGIKQGKGGYTASNGWTGTFTAAKP